MELPFAGLHQLCAPMLGQLDVFRSPSSDALRVALGLASGDAPDRFLVALAALSLLSEVAEERPLLCFVDDAQWLDDASRQVLGFVARRLLAEPVAIVFATRDAERRARARRASPSCVLAGPRRRGCPRAARDRHPGPARRAGPRPDRRRDPRQSARAAGAAPRAERRRSWPAASGCRSAAAVGPHRGELPRRLERAAGRDATLLLVAAAEPVGDPTLMWRAADALEIAGTRSSPRREPGCSRSAHRSAFVIHWCGRRSTDRPRTPSAGARTAPWRRRPMPELDPDRRAWHRAQATRAPTRRSPTELEHSADRAQARGGLAAAAAFLERAAELTVDPARRAERMLAAAQANLQAGAFDAALALLAAAEAGPAGRPRASPGQTCCAPRSRSRRTAAATRRRCCSGPRRRWSRSTPRLARDDLSGRAGARHCSPDGSRTPAVCSRSPRAVRGPLPSRDAPAAPVATCCSTASRSCSPRGAPPPRRCCSALRRRLPVPISRWRRSSGGDGWQRRRPCSCGTMTTCLAVATREVELARESGALERPCRRRQRRSVRPSHWAATSRVPALLVAEADAVTEATGTSVAPYAALVLAAFHGPEADASELIEATIKEGHGRGPGHRCPVRALGERRPA